MLLALRISNVAVIDEAEVQFGPGLTVLTGETGAGKSILLDALGLLLGGRADADVIRAGAEEAVVEATFEATPSLKERLEALGLPDLGGEVCVRRVVQRVGRGKVHVNGALVTVGVLGQLMRGRVDIAGQHEHVSLFDPGRHRELLDQQAELEELREGYREAHATLREVDAQIESLGGDEKKAGERIEFLRYQLEEICRLAPLEGEDEKLEDERRRLAGADRLERASSEAEALLSTQDGSALELLGRAIGLLGEAAKIDGGIAPLLATLHTAASELEEGTRSLARYRGGIDSDPGRLADVDDRLDALKRLCRKHGTDLGGVLRRKAELEAELGRLENRAENLGGLLAERAQAEAEARRRGEALSEARAKAAGRFGRAVREVLTALAMPSAAFEVRVTPGERLGPQGLDEVEFFFSANAGEPVRPLLKVASGGEASRLLLALKRVLARPGEKGCYVLDEVDAGVGGAVAEVVGRLIKDVSAHHQVLCVTHLPQVAAFADHHLAIEKREEKGHAVSRVCPLGTSEARARELARMLSGVEVTQAAVVAAEALVQMAAARRPRPRRRA